MSSVVKDSPELLFDEDGFLLDPLSWTPELAIEIADTDGLLTLTSAHWKIIDYLREHYLVSGTLPVMNHVCRVNHLERHPATQNDPCSDSRQMKRSSNTVRTVFFGHNAVTGVSHACKKYSP